MKTCSCCGQPIYGAPAELVAIVTELLHRLPGQHRRVAETLLASYPRLVSNEQLIAALWDRRKDEPEKGEQTICTYVTHLRHQMRPLGWTIRVVRFSGRQFEQLP